MIMSELKQIIFLHIQNNAERRIRCFGYNLELPLFDGTNIDVKPTDPETVNVKL